MLKEFIPYEQALELKELGFNEECMAIYFVPTKKFIIGKKVNEYTTEVRIYAPTFSTAFRFFRQKHKLIAGIFPNNHSLERKTSYMGYVGKFKKGDIDVYDTYEEAELACLKKLIEIVKNK
jgi:hypothetical protein